MVAQEKEKKPVAQFKAIAAFCRSPTNSLWCRRGVSVMECSVVESWFTWYMHFIQHSQWPFCGEALKSLSLGGKGIKFIWPICLSQVPQLAILPAGHLASRTVGLGCGQHPARRSCLTVTCSEGIRLYLPNAQQRICSPLLVPQL